MKMKKIFLLALGLIFITAATSGATSTPAPKISATPASVNFGSVALGATPVAKIVTIKNTGKSDLSITTINITGTDISEFGQSNSCVTIAAGGTCPVSVTFTPALPYAKKSALLTIASNDPKKPLLNVKLSGQVPPPKISATPSSVNFGTLHGGTVKSKKSVTVKNSGLSDLTIASINIAGTNPGDFSETDNCGTIPKGGSCTIDVVFEPPLLHKVKRSATLDITSNDPQKPTLILKLSGSLGGSKTASIQVSGTINTSNYQVAAKRPSALNAAVPPASPPVPVNPTVDQVIAIPMLNGYLGEAWPCMLYSQYATINGDGTFTLALIKDYDWLLMLIDSTITGPGRFVGAVNVALDSGSLLNLPITDSTQAAMDLGTISRISSTSGDGLTGNTVGTADFNLTAAQLTSLAKTDQLFRNAMNIINNYDNNTGIWYTMRPDFHWYSDYKNLKNTFLNPAGLSYNGMNFQIDTNSTAVNMDDICTMSTIVYLYPPSDITLESGGTSDTYGPSKPLSTANPACGTLNSGRETTGSIISAMDSYGSHTSGPPLTYSVQASFTPTTIPAGSWTWLENATEKASFDIADVNPPISTGGKPVGFVPSYRVNVEDDTTCKNKIISVDIQWYYYDAAGNLTGPLAPADVALLKHFIGQVEVKFDRTYGGNRQTENIYVDPSVTNVVPTKTWYYGQCSTNPLQETGVMGYYTTGGFGYFFDFWNIDETKEP